MSIETIELEADRIAWMTEDGETITSPVGNLPAFVAESSGETFDAGIGDVDGVIMALVTKAQVTAHSLDAGVLLTIRGASYTIKLVEEDEASDSTGFVTLYCEPT